MKHAILIVLILAAVSFLSPAVPGRPQAATTGDTGPQVVKSDEAKKISEVPTEKVVRGKRGRRLTRVDAWVEGLEGDKRRIYERYGHPTSRYREEMMGTVIETWVYSGLNRTFRFKGNKLIR